MKPVVLPELYGIIGDPIAHSLSPILHTLAFQAVSIPAVLLPWQVSKSQLAAFMTASPLFNVKGCCVTLPHKQTILPFLSELTPVADAVGAVNTLFWSHGKLCGENTDVAGFIEPLIQHPRTGHFQDVLILGSGGAARAAIVGLKTQGYVHIALSSRTTQNAQRLAEEFKINVLPWESRSISKANCIINTTPLGMRGVLETETPYTAAWFSGRKGLAYDMIYTPNETRFCREAKTAGWDILSGQAMFFAQANAQFRLWTGHAIPETVFASAKQLLR